MEKKKKPSILDDIMHDSEEIAKTGSEIAKSPSEKRKEALLNQARSLWTVFSPTDRGTENVPGTDNVPPEDLAGTKNVPGTELVPGTKLVPGTEKGSTKYVPGTEKGGTKYVPGTEKVGTEFVPGTEHVPGTEFVPGTENVTVPSTGLLNAFSAIERNALVMKALKLNLPHAARCLLLQLLLTMESSKAKVSITAMAKEVNTRKPTLVSALKSLEEEEILIATRTPLFTVVDLTPFIRGTLSVLPGSSMYVCMNNNINRSYKHTNIGGTESVPGTKNVLPFSEKIREYRIDDLLLVMDLCGLVKVSKGTTNLSKKAIRLVRQAAESDETKDTAMVLAQIAKERSKTNPQGYWVRLMETKDTEEITDTQIAEAKSFLELASRFKSHSFDSPSLGELKDMAKKLLGITESFKDRASIVDFLIMKAAQLEERMQVYRACFEQKQA